MNRGNRLVTGGPVNHIVVFALAARGAVGPFIFAVGKEDNGLTFLRLLNCFV